MCGVDRTYHLSHPTICQSLLLLGIREVGMGATAQAWLYFGRCISIFSLRTDGVYVCRDGDSDGSGSWDASLCGEVDTSRSFVTYE